MSAYEFGESRFEKTDNRLLWLTQEYLERQLRGVAPDSLMVHAWDRFYCIYDEGIRRFALSHGLSESDLDDCTQQVWHAVLAELRKFQPDPKRGRFRTWLYTLVRNKATDLIRRRARDNAQNLDRLQGTKQEPQSRERQPIESTELDWTKELLRRLLLQLRKDVSDANYQVFYMRRFQQRPIDDVARKLGLTPEQVRVQQHRMQRKFRVMLDLFLGCDLAAAE